MANEDEAPPLMPFMPFPVACFCTSEFYLVTLFHFPQLSSVLMAGLQRLSKAPRCTACTHACLFVLVLGVSSSSRRPVLCTVNDTVGPRQRRRRQLRYKAKKSRCHVAKFYQVRARARAGGGLPSATHSEPVSRRCPAVSRRVPPVSRRCPAVSRRCPAGVPPCPAGVPPVSRPCPALSRPCPALSRPVPPCPAVSRPCP